MTSQTQAAAAAYSRLQALTGANLTHHDGEVPIGDAANGPHTIFYASPAPPVQRKLSGNAKALLGFGSVVCVNNSAAGAVRLAERVVDLFDGWQMPGGSIVRCTTGPTLRDPDMAAGYRWSATVQLSYYLTR